MKTSMSLLLLGFAIGLPATGALAQVRSEQENISVQNTQTQTTVTDEALEQLRPVPMPVLPDQEVQRQLNVPAPVQDDQVITIPAVEPSQRSELAFGQVTRADVNVDPYRRAGKLFMTGIGTCTAQVIGALDVVMTAAHCVYSRQTNQWASNVVFVRAFADGGGQRLDWQCMSIKSGWTGSNPYPWDYAFIKLRGSSAGGSLGLQTGLNYNSWISIGYPGNFEGARFMQTVEGRKGTVGGGIAQMNDNPMTFGASGGGWIRGNIAIGLNSFLRGDPSTSTSLWGPVFNSQTVDLYNYVNRGCR
jgi:hypothetical protein